VIARRIALVAAAMLWLGMLGGLGLMEHRKRVQAHGAAGYLDSVFGPEAPALISKSIWLQELFGAEQSVGFIEVQTQLTGENDALVKTSLSVRAEKIPPLITSALTQFVGPPVDLSGELNVFMGRFKGVTRIDGKGSYGKDTLEFMASRFRDRELRIVTRHGKERSDPTYIPYDRNLPFAGDLSPIKGGKSLKLGDSWTVSHFNPMTRTSAETFVQVEEEASLRHKGEEVLCWLVRAHPASAAAPGAGGSFGVSSSTAWVARKPGHKLDGQVIREETQLLFFKVALVLEDLITREELSRDRLDPEKGRPEKPGRPAGPVEPAAPTEKPGVTGAATP
jgi:hypothetical protein